jgi:succinoglycan biosynthesis protein ExoM
MQSPFETQLSNDGAPEAHRDEVKVRHVSVCICTYQRPQWLKRLLETLERQQTRGAFTFSIVVADNDPDKSAEEVVACFARHSSVDVLYCCETNRNIALARNKAINYADGEFIAFIDDDEFPADDWLAKLIQACEEYKSSGVLGPVRPHFEETPPLWLLKGRFCERPEHPTGTVMKWNASRTGNILFRRSILNGTREPFDPEFGTGGEDQDFFRRMGERNCKFIWCNEAIAYETVPPSRWARGYMFKRALLRGRNVLKHRGTRMELVLKSAIAVPAYSLLLPLTLPFGEHVFVKFGIKLCDHLGRLLTLLGINPIRERQM